MFMRKSPCGEKMGLGASHPHLASQILSNPETDPLLQQQLWIKKSNSQRNTATVCIQAFISKARIHGTKALTLKETCSLSALLRRMSVQYDRVKWKLS